MGKERGESETLQTEREIIILCTGDDGTVWAVGNGVRTLREGSHVVGLDHDRFNIDGRITHRTPVPTRSGEAVGRECRQRPPGGSTLSAGLLRVSRHSPLPSPHARMSVRSLAVYGSTPILFASLMTRCTARQPVSITAYLITAPSPGEGGYSSLKYPYLRLVLFPPPFCLWPCAPWNRPTRPFRPRTSHGLPFDALAN